MKDRPGVDRLGRTSLHYAALEGDAGLVRQLLASGLAADAADDNFVMCELVLIPYRGSLSWSADAHSAKVEGCRKQTQFSPESLL